MTEGQSSQPDGRLPVRLHAVSSENVVVLAGFDPGTGMAMHLGHRSQRI